jgi:excisionase family DNA binding protein
MDSLQQPGQTGRGGDGGRRALSVREFCHDYNVSRRTMYDLIEAGQLPDVKVRGKRLVPVDAAERLLQPKGAD